MNQPAMQQDEFERRLGKLALREGMTMATFALLQGADRAVLQTTLVREFERGRVYAEREVNAVLKAWLAGTGSMVETDHVNLRRLLVDTGVLDRTSDCARYRLTESAAAALSPALAAIDAAAVVAAARRSRLEQRAARRAEWERRAADQPVAEGAPRAGGDIAGSGARHGARE